MHFINNISLVLVLFSLSGILRVGSKLEHQDHVLSFLRTINKGFHFFRDFSAVPVLSVSSLNTSVIINEFASAHIRMFLVKGALVLQDSSNANASNQRS